MHSVLHTTTDPIIKLKKVLQEQGVTFTLQDFHKEN